MSEVSSTAKELNPPTDILRRRFRFDGLRAAWADGRDRAGAKGERSPVQRTARIGVVLLIASAWLATGCAVIAGARAGWTLRQWAWEQTDSVRFTGDISNGFRQGLPVYRAALAAAELEHRDAKWRDFFDAYRNRYSEFLKQHDSGGYPLDYTPARLLTMSLWVWRCEHLSPPVSEWDGRYLTAEPLLHFNAVCEAVSAIAVLLLVRLWRDRERRRSAKLNWRSPGREWPALLSAAAVWFNPVLIWDAHVWPQWDVWLVPFFLLATLAVSLRGWTTAGILLVIGAAFKGQLVLVAPVLVILPLLTGDVIGFIRMIAGIGVGGLIVLWPWMFTTPAATVWPVGVTIAAIIAAAWPSRWMRPAAVSPATLIDGKKRPPTRVARQTEAIGVLFVALLVASAPLVLGSPSFGSIAATVTVLLIGVFYAKRRSPINGPLWISVTASLVAVLPLAFAREADVAYAVLPMAIILGTMRWWLPRRLRWTIVLLTAAAATLVTGFDFGGSFDWFTVGYVFPTGHFPLMAVSGSTLPRLLENRNLGWNLHDIVALPFVRPMEMRTFLIWLFAALSTMCAMAAAVHYRRQRAQVLMALTVPWLLLFTVLPQMHERYLVWAAVTMCVGFGLSIADSLAAAGVIFLAWINLVNVNLGFDPKLMPSWLAVVKAGSPGSAWALVTLALVCIYLAMGPRGQRGWIEPEKLLRSRRTARGSPATPRVPQAV